MATRNLSKQLVWSRFIVLAIWSFFLQPIVATLPVAAQNIDLGSVTTILDGANLEQYFSQEDIAASNASSLVEFLGKNNCLVLSTGGTGSQTNISIGGYAGACIKVYVDGVLVNNPNTGEFDWNSLALDAISSITIHNTPILGQEEFAGTTISISTKSFSARRISTSFSTSSYETNAFDTNQLGFQLQDVVAGTALKLSLGSTTAANRYRLINGQTQEGNGYQSASGLVGWNRFVGSHTIGGSHNISYNRLQVPASLSAAGLQTSLSTGHTIFGDLFSSFGQILVQLHYKLDSLTYQEANKTSPDTENSFHNLTLQLDYTAPVFPWQEEKPWILNQLANSQPSFSLKGGAILSSFSSAQTSVVNPSRYSFYPSLTAIFGKGQLVQIQPMAGYFMAWDTTAGEGKQELVFHHNFNGALAINVAYFTLSFSTQNVLPTFNQLYWNYAGLLTAQENQGTNSSNGQLIDHGNPHLKPESGYSIRLKFASAILNQDAENQPRLFKLVPVTASLGFSYYQDKIRWVSGSYQDLSYSTLHTENAGAAYYFDATLHSQNSYKVGSHWQLGYKLNLAVTRTFLLDKAYYGKQIMWVPLVLANLGLEAGYKQIGLQVNYDFTSKRYTSNYNTTYYSPIHLLSCGVSWKYSENLAFTVEGSNLLNQKYLYHDNYSGPSRSYSVKIKTTF
ncbi:MAG: TonB-dependent receptor plug domain-containing protein [Treponema sp.]|nr:TonB-dependent receptor plug domain-containing protein [Treponema sp.]